MRRVSLPSGPTPPTAYLRSLWLASERVEQVVEEPGGDIGRII